MTDENSKKQIEAGKGSKATLQAVASVKSPAVKESSQVQTMPKAEIQTSNATPETVKQTVTQEKTQPAASTESVKAVPAGEAAKSASESKPQKAAKEADPSKEFVDSIMTEMNLKGASKKRLVKMLGEQLNFDKQKVMFKLKRALITERYAAAHSEAGH